MAVRALVHFIGVLVLLVSGGAPPEPSGSGSSSAALLRLRRLAARGITKRRQQQSQSPSPPPGQHRISKHHVSNSSLAMGACLVDTGASAFYLAESLVTAASATDDCHNDEHNAVPCVADIFGVIQSVMNTAAYATVAAVVCSPHAMQRAACAADAEFAVGAASEAVQALVSMRNTCGEMHRGHRRLGALVFPDSAAEKEKRGAAIDVAWCVVGTGSAGVYVSMAAVVLADTITGCSASTWAEAAVGCTGNVFDIIGALGNVVSYISTAVATCPHSNKLDELCASDVGTLINALGSLESGLSGISTSCVFNGTTTIPARNTARALARRTSMPPASAIWQKAAAVGGVLAVSGMSLYHASRFWRSASIDVRELRPSSQEARYMDPHGASSVSVVAERASP